MKVQQANISQFFAELARSQGSTAQSAKAVLFYGTEEALILDYVLTIKKLKKSLIFENLDPETENYLQSLQTELMTDSMFGESKLLYIPNFKKTDGKKLTDILKNVAENSPHLVIITSISGLDASNVLRKMFETVGHFAAIGVYAETDVALKNLAKQTMESLKLQHTAEVPELLSRMFSNNRSVLKQEIYKLYTYNLSKSQIITPQIVHEVLSAEADLNIFQLQNTIFEKNIKQTIKLLNEAQASEMHPTVVFATISKPKFRPNTMEKCKPTPMATSQKAWNQNHNKKT
jgi:DNA polymerase III delta subunit